MLPSCLSLHHRNNPSSIPPPPPSPQGLETYKGSWDCAVQILRNHGVKGLYRGMTSTVLRDIQVRCVLGMLGMLCLVARRVRRRASGACMTANLP